MPPLRQEPQAHLNRALAVRLCNAGEHLVAVDAAAGHGTIGDGRHAMPPARRNDLRLVDERMHLDLIADQRLVRQPHRFVDQGDGKVRNPDMACKSHALDLAERAERLAQRDLRVRPVQQQQIDLREPQPRQALLGRALEFARRKVRRPYLRGDEHLVSCDAGSAHAFADLALVVVHLRGVDVAVAKAQRLFDQARAAATTQVPGAETDHRDAGAVGFDDLALLSFGFDHWGCDDGVHTSAHLPSALSRKPRRNSARRAVSRLRQKAFMGEAMVPRKKSQ